jgi:hypothetical protein
MVVFPAKLNNDEQLSLVGAVVPLGLKEEETII